MNHELRLSDIGEGLDQAEIIEWKVRVGDQVERDQPIIEIMTDKSTAELPAPVSGVVVELGCAVGDMVEVGHLLAVIAAQESDAAGAGAAPGPSAGEFQGAAGSRAVTTFRAATAPPAPATAASAPGPERSGLTGTDASKAVDGRRSTGARPKASPSTRATAARRGIDLATVAGSGPGGRILISDLDNHIGSTSPTHPDMPDQSPAAARDHSAHESTTGLAQPSQSTHDSLEPKTPAATVRSSAAAPQLATVAVDSAGSTHGDPSTARADLLGGTTAGSEPTSDDTSSGNVAVGVGAPSANMAPGGGTTADQGTTSSHDTVEPLRGIRRVIATNMQRSWTTIPHIHVTEHVDSQPMLAFRAQLRASGRPEFGALTPVSFFVAAVASALKAHPQANASLNFEQATITRRSDINVGIAVAAPAGLVVPVVQDAGSRSLAEIAAEVRRLVEGARAGTLDTSEFRQGTTTITNFGSLGGEVAQPLIRPPESTIFGFGAIASRPFVIDDKVVARKTMHVVIGADHRLLDGDVTTAVLSHATNLLKSPINLVLS